jgi:hypothetical protein
VQMRGLNITNLLLCKRPSIEIRIRAERRAGEFLKALNPHQGGDRKSKEHRATSIAYKEAKEIAKISADQSKRWQKLAEILKRGF